MAKRAPDARRGRGKTELVGTLMDGRVRIERLPTTQYLSARMWIGGGHVRRSTGETSLARAKAAATKLYARLVTEAEQGIRVRQERTRTFGAYAEKFFADPAERRRRSAGQWDNLHDKWTMLEPPPPKDGKPAKPPVMVNGVSVARTRITDIDLAWLEDLREVRSERQNKRGERISNETLKKDLQFIFQVLKRAKAHGVISALPEMPSFDGEWAVNRDGNPRMTNDEVHHLLSVAKKRIEDAENDRVRAQRTDLYRMTVMSIDAALRVDEALSLRFCDCEPYTTDDGRPMLRLWVLGKHRSAPDKREIALGSSDSVKIFDAIKADRPAAKPDESLFDRHRDASRELFEAAGLRETKDGRLRTRKCYRVTGITRRIEHTIETRTPLDVERLAKWARTSPEMIRSFYDQTKPEASGELVVLNDVPTNEPPSTPAMMPITYFVKKPVFAPLMNE